MNNLYILNVDMQNRSVEEIARDAAVQIIELFDCLVEEKQKKDNPMCETESKQRTVWGN